MRERNKLKLRRPPLRYHGGKWLLAPWVISHFPAHRVYVEPFGGAASVLLRKDRVYAEVYNDLDSEIVNLFQVLRDRDRAAELYHLLRLTPFARDEFVVSYIPNENPVEQARLTLVRSFMGFGTTGTSGRKTGFRCDIARNGSTPAIDWQSFPEHIQHFTERLSGVVIENRPYRKVIETFDSPNTLHYIDPPYPQSTRTPTATNGKNYRHEMMDDDHRELADVLNSVKGMVVISGYPCALYDEELYPTWQRFERPHLADRGAKRIEVLWLNTAAYSALRGRDS